MSTRTSITKRSLIKTAVRAGQGLTPATEARGKSSFPGAGRKIGSESRPPADHSRPSLPLAKSAAPRQASDPMISCTSASRTARPKRGPPMPSASSCATTKADAGDGAGAALAALDWQSPPSMARTARGSNALLGILGHSQECIGHAMSGQITVCDCRTKPMEDPAVAVALAIHYARTAIDRGIPIPAVVLELLTLRVREGDPTCRAVGQWLDERGLLDVRFPPSLGRDQ